MEKELKVSEHSKSFNKLGYWAFVIAGLFFLFFSSDKSNGVMFLCLAFVFEPFDDKVPFKERTLKQRVWLIIHLTIAIAAFVWMITIGLDNI